MTELNNHATAMPKTSGLLLGWGTKACLLSGIFFLPLLFDVAIGLLAASGALLVGRMAWTGEWTIRKTKLDLWLAGFVIMAAASTPGSIFAYESWYNYYHVVTLYILMYLLVTQTVFSDADAKKIVAMILASACAVCLIGFFQYAVGVDVTAERWIDGEQFPELKTRIFSTMGNPNVLAAFLVMIIGISGGWGTDPGNSRRSFALIGLTMLAFLCLVLTYSRGAWLAVGTMALETVMVRRKPGKRMLLGGIATMAALFYLAYDTLALRMLSILDMFNSNDSSVALRWALWESTIAMIEEQPWLGIGWGAYPYVYPYYDFFVQNENVMIYHAHNSVLSLAAEIGIPGTLCFLTACGLAAKILFHSFRAGKSGNGLQFGLLLSMLGLAAFSLTDHVLFNVQVMADFWGLLAIVACMPESGNPEKFSYWVNKKIPGLAGFFSLR